MVFKVCDKTDSSSCYALKVLKKSKVSWILSIFILIRILVTRHCTFAAHRGQQRAADQGRGGHPEGVRSPSVYREADRSVAEPTQPAHSYVFRDLGSLLRLKLKPTFLYFCAVSEYVPNGELFSKIGHFSIDLVRLYIGEIALALGEYSVLPIIPLSCTYIRLLYLPDFLHNAGIIYRDAKPENILLTQQFHVKLTDFGLSKWLKLGANTRTMCGTFKYMGTIQSNTT